VQGLDDFRWVAAHKHGYIREFLDDAMRIPGYFAPNRIRREVNKLLSKRRMDRGEGTGMAFLKPSAGCPKEMFYSNQSFFRRGATPLPAGVTPLKVDAIAHLHKLSCSDCKFLPEGVLCTRGATYCNLITFGWDPWFFPEPSIHRPILSKPNREYKGNSTKANKFPQTLSKAFSKYEMWSAERLPNHARLVRFDPASDVEHGFSRGYSVVIVDPYTNERQEWVEQFIGVPSPMGISLKRTEVIRAANFTVDGAESWKLWSASPGRQGLPYSDYKRFYAHRGGIDITRGEEHLLEANSQLEEQGQPPIKGRATIDTSASDINTRAWTPAFTADSSAADILFKEAYMAQGDLATYFLNFPLAERAWAMFVVYLRDSFWRLRCASFGFGPCPYYCSGWSAEVKSWFTNIHLLPIASFVDNFLTVGKGFKEAERRLELMIETVAPAGFTIPRDYAISKRMVYLGILYDTDKMTMSIDSLKAMALEAVLTDALRVIQEGKSLSATDINSIAGRMENMSQVWQTGKAYTRIWWTYLKYGRSLYPHLYERLHSHTRAWINQLRVWSKGETSGAEIPLLTWDVLCSTPGSIRVIQSDASGIVDHGFGYISYTWKGNDEDDQHDGEFVAHGWDEEYHFIHSHHGELQPYLHHLRDASFTDCLLLCISDNESAMWSINKGSCKDDDSLTTLIEILEIADSKRIQLLGFWIPREINEVPDYLSHLTNILHSQNVRGPISEGFEPHTAGADSRGESSA